MSDQIKSKKIEIIEISKLKKHPKNNNIHPNDQIERLAKLIAETGFRTPIIVSNLSGCVVSGHGRLDAVKKVGLKEVPVIFQNFKDEAEEYAYMTADNAIASWATLNLSQINNDFLEFGPEFDIDLLGINGFTLDMVEHGFDIDDNEEDQDKSSGEFCLEAKFPNQIERDNVMNDLQRKGYIVKAKNG